LEAGSDLEESKTFVPPFFKLCYILFLRGYVPQKEATDTSDTVYEKRHRKYETFEKRLRLREKEKLKHEQYKLKERIEQLRVMDPSAFLAMPSTHFSSVPDPGAEEEGLPVGTHPNGPPAHNEGERRRQEMLDVALSLEERYRALLPHDKKAGSERGRERPSASVEPLDVDEEASDDDEEAEAVAAQLSRQERGKLKLKIRFSRQGRPPLDRPRNRKANSPSPSPSPTPRRSRVAGSPTSPTLLRLPGQKWRAATLKARSSRRISSPHRGSTASSDSDPDTADVNGHDHRPRSKHPYKYKKREIPDDSPSHSEREPIPTGPARPVVDSTGHTNCVLLAAALRASAAPKARHTQRNILAFGTVVPEQITAFRNFKLPWWIKDDDEAEPEGEEGS
jgi:hypothetical protein